MPTFGARSMERLDTCHDDLKRLFLEVVKERDCSILCGHRGEAEQNEAFANGFSKLPWPKGKHNKLPSLAVDVIPWPFVEADWKDEALFHEFSDVVKCKAAEMGIKVSWGGDWQTFKDLPHWEIPSARI